VSGYRDLVISQLLADEAELIDRVVDLIIERDAYRELAHAAVHQSHDLTQQLDRLRVRHHRLFDDFRALRAQQREAVAA